MQTQINTGDRSDALKAVGLLGAKKWVEQYYATHADTGKPLLASLKVKMDIPGQKLDMSNFEAVYNECHKVQCALDHLAKQVETMQKQYSELLSSLKARGSRPPQQVEYLNLLAGDLLRRINDRQKTYATDITETLKQSRKTNLTGMFGQGGTFHTHKRYLNRKLNSRGRTNVHDGKKCHQ
jgi:hypothetical protein